MNQVLPDSLVWEAVWEGDEAAHLSELALTAIADGEEAILPASAMAHVETCEACGRKLGEAAMLSSVIGAALRGAPSPMTATATATATATKTRDSGRPRARLPLGAISAGLALAIFGAIPMLLDFPSFVADARLFALRGLPVVLRGGVSVARSGGFDRTASTLTIASAFVLVIASFFLLRRSLPSRASRTATEGVS